MNSTALGQTHPHSDPIGAKIGMWLFLFSEIILFGGLFLLYAVFRGRFPGDFHFCAANLDLLFGSINTVVLLTSSLTMVIAVATIKQGNLGQARLALFATLLLGLCFMVVKYFEWTHKFALGIFPGSTTLGPGESVFYGLYFAMTGLHGFHVLVGMVLIGVFAIVGKSVSLENVGLYWHLVDLIWIYLFPLLYLVS